MPAMDGLELVETLKEEHPLLPVILMTSKGSEQIAVRALRAGASSYVPKSALKQELVETVRQVLDVAEASRKQREVVRYLNQCETTFELINDKELLGPFVGYLLENLRRLCFGSESVRTQVGIALMEALSNALIHGNLQLDSELRRTDREKFDQLMEVRANESPYRSRRIHCLARESPQKVEYVIRDEGAGFDPDSLPDPTTAENVLQVSGRGVMLIRTFMDSVHYNEKGNEISMIKLSQRE
jgi:DNA-binding response OmpR family regulator